MWGVAQYALTAKLSHSTPKEEVSEDRECKEFSESKVFKDFSLISHTSLNSLTISSQICVGMKNRTREDVCGEIGILSTLAVNLYSVKYCTIINYADFIY